jgi:hypothetical protein
MKRVCGACQHSDRPELEKRYGAGDGPVVLERVLREKYPGQPELQLSKDALLRHFENLRVRGGCPSDPRRGSREVEGFHLSDDGDIVEVADPRFSLSPSDSRYASIAAQFGVGDSAGSDSFTAGETVVADDDLTAFINSAIARSRAEAAKRYDPETGRSIAGRGTCLDWVTTLERWQNARQNANASEERELLRDIDQRHLVPVVDWHSATDTYTLIRKRIKQLERELRRAKEEREQQGRDALDVEFEELSREVGALALDAESDPDAAFRLDEVERRLAAIEVQRRRKTEAQRERERRERQKLEAERREQLAAAKAHSRALALQQETHHRTVLMPALVALCDAVATDSFIAAERSNAGMAVARFNGGSSGGDAQIVSERRALVSVLNHALATRAGLPRDFHLAWNAEGPLFSLWLDACAAADARRDGEIAAEDPELEATKRRADLPAAERVNHLGVTNQQQGEEAQSQ